MDFINTNSSFTISATEITSDMLIHAAKSTNIYLITLSELFSQINFDVFYSLGQRNLSGFIGEIYKNILSAEVEPFHPNPHPDGRPDILSLDSELLIDYYKECFNEINGRSIPVKSCFSPFKFGGLEVKCCIGESTAKQKEQYKNDHNGMAFGLYAPRVGYLNNVNWWAHHSGSSNLLGLYYDYYAPQNNMPQILAAFYSTLSADNWTKVSVGKPGNKKTSNTSLNASGKKRMKDNCVFYCSDKIYVTQLMNIGIEC